MRHALTPRSTHLPGTQQQIKGKIVHPARKQQPAVLEQLLYRPQAVEAALPVDQ